VLGRIDDGPVFLEFPGERIDNRFGFRELELDPIVAVSDPDNAASHKVLHKIGLRAAGTATHYGRELPFFELGRDEYLARV